jgi:Flp pilus assembly protein TadG
MMTAMRNIWRDERGGAAVDMIVLLPIMLMVFIGVVEITSVLRLDRKVVAAAQTTADLITQRREVSAGDLNDILRAAELIMEPYPASDLSVGIVGVQYNENTGAPETLWTQSKNGGSVPNALAVAVGLGAKGEGVVVVRVSYSYSPVFFDFIMGQTTLEETTVLRPRRSSIVEGPGA